MSVDLISSEHVELNERGFTVEGQGVRRRKTSTYVDSDSCKSVEELEGRMSRSQRKC